MGLKQKLAQHEITIGSWISLAHPGIAEIMANAGFDWLVIDLEHSVITIREAEELIRVIQLKGVTALVRLSANDPILIKRVMDAGADGVIIPMVNSAEEALKAVKSVYYPPYGNRGVGLARAQGYGTSFDDYRSQLSDNTVVIVQVEHITAVKNLGSILEVDGVDGFIVGPYDLSGSLGIPGQFQDQKMVNAMKTIQDISEKFHANAGFHVVPPDPALLKDKIKQGYTFLAYSVDFLFLGEMCRQGLKEIRTFQRES